MEVRVNGSIVETEDGLPIFLGGTWSIRPGEYRTFSFRYHGPWEGSILLTFTFLSGRNYTKLVDLETASKNPIEGAYSPQPFIKTPLGTAAVGGGVILVAVTLMIVTKRKR